MQRRKEFGYCGADCSACSIYRANIYGEVLDKETLDRWRKDAKQFWGIERLSANDLNCRGCRYDGEEIFFAFRSCPVKKCARDRNFVSCGLCPDLKDCNWIEPEGRDNLK